MKGVNLETVISADPEYDISRVEQMVPLIAEFFSLNGAQVWARVNDELRSPGSTVARAWKLAAPSDADAVKRFYSETDSYVFDLVVDHCHERRRGPWEALIGRINRRGPDQRVLAYGDGIGSDSISLARNGHRVTYFDLPGVTSAFARFRFERENLSQSITPIAAESEISANSFDAAVCIEVLEHVSDPPGVMRALHSALKPGGIALISESFESIGDEFPSHLPENFQYAGRTHQLMEEIGFANTYYNVDPVNRPMEFTKLRPNLSGDLLKVRGKVRRAIETRWRRVSQASRNESHS